MSSAASGSNLHALERELLGSISGAGDLAAIEQARITVLGGLDPFILARVEIDFRSELRMNDEIEIRTRCSRIGTKSFELEHQIWTGERLAAEAKSVLVGYDYHRGTSVPIPDETKRRLSE